MSTRPPEVSVLTANRLQDGTVVYLAADGRWIEGIDAAAVAYSGAEAQALKEQGARDAMRNLVVDPYLAAVAESRGHLVPARMRERVRVEGPSILGSVPGYIAPSVRAAPTSSPSPSARGEGRGSPLAASGERGSAEAA